MDVLEALGGWRNINQEKLEQIKVDNPPLYDAITKAINLLAKKYGGENIIIQKPIEDVEEVVTINEYAPLEDYSILKKIYTLRLAKGDWALRKEIVDSFFDEYGVWKEDVVKKSQFDLLINRQLENLETRDLVTRIGNEFAITPAGKKLIDKYELQNKQVEGLQVSDEDLKLEILLRMTDYYDGGDYKWLNNYDITNGAIKHFVNIPETRVEELKTMLVNDFFIEKGSGGTFRLTNKGYDKAMGWFEENLPEEEEEANPYDFPSERQDQVLIAVYDAERNFDRFVTLDEIYDELLPNLPANYPKSGIGGEPTLEKDLQILEGNNLVIRRLMTLPKIGAEYAIDTRQLAKINVLKMKRAKAQKTTTPFFQTPQYDFPQDRLEGILKRLSEARAKIHDYVSIEDLKRQLYDVVVPLNYATYEVSGEPSLEDDLNIMKGMGLVKSRITLDTTTQTMETEYDIDTQGSEMLTQLKLEEAQQQKASSLRPSPTKSATLFATGTKMYGNDGNPWMVTQTKNGVKRWTKVGEIPSDEPKPTPMEIPISEIDEDEVDLDILEQQLNDDSLEFDISDEDLDNLEF